MPEVDSRALHNGYRFRMAIPRSEIDQVREATDLVALVGEVVALRPLGTVAVRFRRGTFLIDGALLRRHDGGAAG